MAFDLRTSTDVRRRLETFPHRFVLSQNTPQGVTVIRVHRPAANNALHPAAMFQLDAAVKAALESPDVRGIVITASEPGFVLGAEIGFLVRRIEHGDFAPIHIYTRLGNDCFDRIAESRKPVVAAVNGPAFGGGLELALACHVRLACPQAVAALPETGLGLCPLWGGVLRSRQLFGTGLAKWLVYTARNTSAREAAELGIYDRIVEPERLLETAVETAANPAAQNDFRGKTHADIKADRDIIHFFENETVASILQMESIEKYKKTIQMSIKQVRKKSKLALLHCEKMFDWSNEFRADEIDRACHDVVETLYRSKDTMTGLQWKLAKKIGTPDFNG